MKKEQSILIFGYGSLMNDQSRLRSAPQSTVIDRNTVLPGYQRIFNVAYGQYVYANIQPKDSCAVAGTVMEVSEEGYKQLQERECHYDSVDVSGLLENSYGGPVYAFVGKDNTIGNETIKQSYIDLCLSGVTEPEREQWLNESDISFDISINA